MKNGPLKFFAFLGMIKLFNQDQIEAKWSQDSYLSTKKIFIFLSPKKFLAAFNKDIPLLPLLGICPISVPHQIKVKSNIACKYGSDGLN